jgi:membrane fusion protein, multidrug efflux system
MASNRSTSVSAIRRIAVLLPVALLAAVVLFASSCSNEEPAAGGNQHSAQAGAGHGGAAHPGGQPGGRPDQPAIPVAVGHAWTGSIASYYNSTSTLESEREAQVLARVSGVVRRLAAEEGDEIPAEGPLLTIANDEYRLRVQQAEATTANLRARFNRMEAMLGEQLSTEEEYQAAKSDLATAEAEEGLARLNLSYTTVRAPFQGYVTGRLVDVGQNVTVGDPLYVLADFHPLLARVHVPSREFHQLQPNQTVDLVLDSDGSRLKGTIKLVSPIIDATSGTIKITVEVSDYPTGTRPGDFAEVRIVTELRPEAVLVPRSAVLTDKGERVVYVALEAEQEGDPEQPDTATAERRVVEVGFTDDENAQILTGLNASERVVVKGQRSLKHGSLLKILETDDAGAGS